MFFFPSLGWQDISKVQPTIMIFAIGANNTLQPHIDQGNFTVTFDANQPVPTTTTTTPPDAPTPESVQLDDMFTLNWTLSDTNDAVMFQALLTQYAW